MNILITGGFGHIGSYLLNSINKIKNIKNVYVIDNNLNNRINTLFKYNKKKIKLIVDDLLNKNVFKKINHKIDIIIHLASITNAEESLSKEKEVFRNNYDSFINIIKYAKKNKSKLIHISSTSVYGSQKKIVDENCKDLIPQSPYAHVKILEENYISKKKISYITLRFGTIVGYSTGMRFHTAVNKFCFETIKKKPITVWKTAINQYRPYLSIKDSFKIIKFIIENNYFDNKIHNIYSNNYTVRDIINFIKKNSQNVRIKYTYSKIMNQLSYKLTTYTGLRDKARLGKEIKLEIKNIFSAFKNIN